MNRKINIIEAAMKYRQIILAFVIAAMTVGVVALMNMPRNEFPEFTIRQGVIVGIYPGATSIEVEEQLTKEVENYIFGYKEINKVKTYSNSRQGQMIIFVELNDDVLDADKFWNKLRLGLDELKMQLPSGVLALIGTNDFGDTSALLLTMSSKEKNYRELEVVMKDLESKIRRIESVSKIKRYGEQKEKVFIYVKPEKLNEYGIQPAAVLMSFKLQEALNYAGELDNGELVLPVHLPPRFETEKDIEDQIIYSDPQGNIIRIKDVARVERKYDKPSNYIRNNGSNALLLSLEMQAGNNIVLFGDEVQDVIAEFKSKVDDDVELNIISNQPEVVEYSISHFMKEFIIAILAVIVVTMILLPFRVSAVAAVTIPISVLITMAIMQVMGFQLDIVSLAGLIVVLGMVVDNAIVIIDNHIEQLDQGQTPWNAAWKAATELFIPVLSATAAIIAAFMPMMIFLEGMASDFVGAFPMTIAIALVVSMVIALFMVPFMCFVFIKKGLNFAEEDEPNKKSFLDRVQNVYNKGLDWTFKNPKWTISGGVLSVVIAIVLFSKIDMQMFPTMDRQQFAVEVYLPEGASLDRTERVISEIEEILIKDDRIVNIASFIGNGSPRFHTVYAPHMPSKNYGQILVNTISNDATVDILNEYSKKYADYFPDAQVKWKQIAMEQFDAPLQVRVMGDSIDDLYKVANKIEEIYRKSANTTWVRNDWLEKRGVIQVDLNRQKANQLGYSKTMVAGALMSSLNGTPLTTIWEDDYPVDVVWSYDDESIKDIQDLKNQQIPSMLTTESLPLRAIGKLNPAWTEGNISRRNGVRTMTVKADVERGMIYSKVFDELKPAIDALELPEGISIEYGGEYEGMVENFIPLGYSLGFSLILIFFILMLQFKTARRALLIMATMLLSLFGAVLGLLIAGYPFSMTAFIGLIGLMGITVRNGIILIDYAMHLVTKEGYSYRKAAEAAGKRRMRPIFLTSMAAAMGVVPMITSGSPLWGPLGSVICFGLIFGMILTLFVLPALYWKSVNRENFKQFPPIENKKAVSL
ncbi:MAG: efflux RND transporter permease subunit [Salinivirgaceae bacterium]|jgi:multidrug efflux pump subunit AcrB|nr:efflux RND transporter permease subunit [Salinivirgaceae bacterium]